MAVDFSKLGGKKIGDVPPPPKEPDGTYHGTITKWQWAESGFTNEETGQKVGQLHLTIRPTEYEGELPSNIKLRELFHTAQLNADSDKDIYVLQELLRSFGIPLDRSLNEAIPDLLNTKCTYEVFVKTSSKSGKDFTNVRRLRPYEQ